MEIRSFDAVENSLGQVRDFIASWMETNGISVSFANKIAISADEITANIVEYSSAKTMEVCCDIQDDLAVLTFSDDGRAFNPLEEVPEPDVSAELADRKIGGLGIFLVKKLMQSVSYKRIENRNVLEIRSTLK